MIDFPTYYEVVSLYAEYASALDNNRWSEWPEFFTEECTYKVQPRENYDRGYPLATLSFESKGMLKDRIYGATETIFHEPYYQRHVIGLPKIGKTSDSRIEAEANYSVFRTRSDGVSIVYNVGRYIDIIQRGNDGLKFESRLCIFDTEMIPNSLIYPI
ncbi:aromatic-ring-hydroxylating dioxygenase subunit beta [Paralcaligenes sp. KSB-10]|uniref:aromatic-ring-hydroxylating dioxygenase subunit beta n=1 Tax=Paralcaligenes sp. KSB-10 TaxID=2901142 RepID=UPI001E3879CC|nr:aromatic-ring-hydroxylating dioxygenase subunit beta [Paralcaligenes sp. KSB-10]UHL64001.1 aromatic-ring-hydroxylating dioxygenase subunit beta [Paralcaligenes sp. KSB-10]